MAKQFSVKIKGDAESAVAKFKAAAAKNDVLFNGDHRAGKFNGMGIEGVYGISGELLTVTIEKKPLLIPWSLIESKVKDFF